MNKYIFIVLASLTCVILGCKSEIKNINDIAREIIKSDDSKKETASVKKLMEVVNTNEVAMTVDIYINGERVPISNFTQYIDDQLVVRIGFANGKITKWAPINNSNIYLLLQE